MTGYLPPNLLALFAPREQLPFVPPVQALPHEKKRVPYGGVASAVQLFETEPPIKAEPKESREERRKRRRREKYEKHMYKLEQEIALWDAQNNSSATGDAYKSLFVARINYDTSESKLRREFESYGAIRKIRLVQTKEGKARGYAFIEYEHERDMHYDAFAPTPTSTSSSLIAYYSAGEQMTALRALSYVLALVRVAAYKYADGRKIDGRRVLVDVERGRTAKGWMPRRLGGGLGGRKARPPKDEMREGSVPDARNRDADRGREPERRDRGDRRRDTRDDDYRERGGNRGGGDRDRGRPERRERKRDRDERGDERDRKRSRRSSNDRDYSRGYAGRGGSGRAGNGVPEGAAFYPYE